MRYNVDYIIVYPSGQVFIAAELTKEHYREANSGLCTIINKDSSRYYNNGWIRIPVEK